MRNRKIPELTVITVNLTRLDDEVLQIMVSRSLSNRYKYEEEYKKGVIVPKINNKVSLKTKGRNTHIMKKSIGKMKTSGG